MGFWDRAGENIASDTAVNHTDKLIYRTNHLTSTLFAVDEDGTVALHMMYDEWGNPQVNTEFNINKSGVSNLNNYTGYTYDDVLGIYYAQNRFYDAGIKRFIKEDPIKDGMNWYSYVGNNPVNKIDPLGLVSYSITSGDLMTTINTTTFEGFTGNYVKLADLADVLGNTVFTKAAQTTNTWIATVQLHNDNSAEKQKLSLIMNQASEVLYLRAANGERTVSNINNAGLTDNQSARATNYLITSGGYNYIDLSYFKQLVCSLGFEFDISQRQNEVYAEIINAHYNNLTQQQKEANAIYIYHYLSQKGWTIEAIAGLLGNIDEESVMNPAQGEGGGNGYGLVQWTPAEGFFKYSGLTREKADKLAEDNPTELMNIQLDYIIYSSLQTTPYAERRWYPTYDYQSPYKMTFEQYITSSHSAYDLAYVFHASYERSRDDEDELKERAEAAKAWYAYLTK